jgi:hypothetical protein
MIERKRKEEGEKGRKEGRREREKEGRKEVGREEGWGRKECLKINTGKG